MTRHLASLFSLFLGTGILLIGHGLQLSVMPLRAAGYGWTSAQIGWTGSFYFAGFLLGCFSVPKLVSSVGHIRVFTVLTATLTAALLTLALTDSLPAWLVLRACTGWSIAGLYLVVESWVNEQADNSNRGLLLSAYTVTALGSLALGQLLLNLAHPASHQIVILAAALVVLAAVPVGLTRVQQPHPVPAARFSPLRVMRTCRSASAAAFLSGLVTGSYYALGPLFGSSVGLDVSAISLMMAAGILGGAAFQWPIGRLSDSVDRRVVLCVTMVVGAIVCVACMRAPTNYLPYLVFLFGATAMPLYALALAHAGDTVEDAFLEIGTGILMLNASGAIVGPLAASALMTAFSPVWFFGFSAGAMAVGAVLMLIFVQRRRALRPHYSRFEVATSASAQGAIELDPRSLQDDDQRQPDANH